MATLSTILTRALKDVELLPRDAAAVDVAKRYAKLIDDESSLVADVGPKLLAVLTSLGMTPAGRGSKGGGGQSVSPVGSKLDELEERRERRARGVG